VHSGREKEKKNQAEVSRKLIEYREIYVKNTRLFEKHKKKRVQFNQQKFINKKKRVINLADKTRRCCARDIKDKRIDGMNYKRNRRSKSV